MKIVEINLFQSLDDLLHFIIKFPAVDVPLVQHGKWIDLTSNCYREHNYKCSVCGDTF